MPAAREEARPVDAFGADEAICVDEVGLAVVSEIPQRAAQRRAHSGADARRARAP
jgi:hypothetical protein